jgi:starch synthase
MCPFLDWSPHVIHCNDWPTGLIPSLLSLHNRPEILKHTKSVFTIHNMAHHGHAPKELLRFSGLYEHYWHPFAMEACGTVNVMKGALQFADKITTVSETYAEEIKTPTHGYGLDDVLRYRAENLIGICNGIDGEIWNPATDKFLPKNFNRRALAGKKICKRVLQNTIGLEERRNVPIFGVISRFFQQKGLDILCDILPQVLKNMVVQFAILGSGDFYLERKFMEMVPIFGGKLAVKIGFDTPMAHLIFGGSDLLVMPSRYEPCGLTQMQAMAYGTLPIVHATGGLRDTVENHNELTGTGTGFVFNDLTKLALHNTIGWACATYYDRHENFEKMQRSAMARDFSWEKSAIAYENVYEEARA